MNTIAAPTSVALFTGAPSPRAVGYLPPDGRVTQQRAAFHCTLFHRRRVLEIGQTKIKGFAIDIVNKEFSLGWPHLSNNAVLLCCEECNSPLEAGAAGRDDGDPSLCLPRRLSHARRVSCCSAVRRGARSRQAVD